MNLTIGVTTNRVGQYKQAVTNKKTAQKQSYANNVFCEFSKDFSVASKNNALSLLNTNVLPSFKGSTTAGTPA